MNSRCPSCARKNGVSPHLEDSFFIKSQMQSLYWIPTDNFEVSIDSLWINSLILTVFSFPIAYFVKFSNRIVFTEAICTLLWWPTPGVKKKIKIQLFPRLTWQPLNSISIKCQTLDRQCRFPSSVEILRRMVKFCGPYKTEFVLWTSGWLYATQVFDRSSLQLKEVHLPNMYKKMTS